MLFFATKSYRASFKISIPLGRRNFFYLSRSVVEPENCRNNFGTQRGAFSVFCFIPIWLCSRRLMLFFAKACEGCSKSFLFSGPEVNLAK